MHSILTSEVMLHNWNNFILLCDFVDFAASRQHPSDHGGPRCLLWFPTVPASSLKLYRNPSLCWPSRLHGASELCPDIHRATFCVRLEQALQSWSPNCYYYLTLNLEWDIFARFARALSSQIFFSVNQSWQCKCNKNTGIDKIWSWKVFTMNQFISRNHEIKLSWIRVVFTAIWLKLAILIHYHF